MTEVAFHFNVPDKLVYGCRLLRKAVHAGARVVVTAPGDVLTRLDALLWTFSQTDFIAHARQSAPEHVVAASPVVLTEAPTTSDLPHRQVLVNLGQQLPDGFDDYERLIEVVGMDEEDRRQARERWKYYADQGYTIVRHDVNLKGT